MEFSYDFTRNCDTWKLRKVYVTVYGKDATYSFRMFGIIFSESGFKRRLARKIDKAKRFIKAVKS